jgi:hypothetical protein
VPHLRTWWVEHRLGLTEDRRPAVIEMQQFVDRHAPAVRITTNVRRQDRLVRIYPVGWRRARIAAFGPMIVLWRRDRAAAEAALLHEIAHYRTGDHVIVGLGSPFVTFINLWLPLFVLLGITPTLVFAVVYPIGHLLLAQLALLVTLLPRMLLLPVSGLWLAELSADRYVVELGWEPALRRALDTQSPRRHRILALVADLAHPPVAVRRWAAGRGGHSIGAVLLLSGFPLLHLGLLLVILSSAVPGWRLLGQPWSQILSEAVVDSHGFLVNAAQLWIPAVLLVLAWPVASTLWSRWWTGRRQPQPGVPDHSYRAAAALCTILLLGGLILTSCGYDTATESPTAAAPYGH